MSRTDSVSVCLRWLSGALMLISFFAAGGLRRRLQRGQRRFEQHCSRRCNHYSTAECHGYRRSSGKFSVSQPLAAAH